MSLQNWFRNHSLKLLAIRDTPEAIAGGVAIGIFFGFSPLIGLKTLLSLLVAWLTRSNLLAAAISVTLHDFLLPFMPFIFRLEYDVGYWLLSHPHEWPATLRRLHWGGMTMRHWTSFFTGVGKPLLLGSLVCAAPVAAVAFVMARQSVTAYRRRHPKPAGGGWVGPTSG